MSSSRNNTFTGIPGSLRRNSFNRRVLQAAARELPGGVELGIWESLARIRRSARAQETLRRALNASADAAGEELAAPHAFRQFDHAGWSSNW